jgi:hypothetical protein
MVLRLRLARLCVKQADLLLEQYAQRVGAPGISSELSKYLEAKKEFDSLAEKYEIFNQKEKSVESAANLVGLRLPCAVK